MASGKAPAAEPQSRKADRTPLGLQWHDAAVAPEFTHEVLFPFGSDLVRRTEDMPRGVPHDSGHTPPTGATAAKLPHQGPKTAGRAIPRSLATACNWVLIQCRSSLLTA